jgi:hypothetical protein
MMRWKKALPIAVLPALLVVIGAAVLLIPGSSATAPKDVHIVITFDAPPAANIESRLRHYQDITPGIRLRIHSLLPEKLPETAGAEDGFPADLVLHYGSLPDTGRLKLSAPHLWTGDLWTLAVNSSLPDKSTLDSLLRTEDLAEFSGLLQDIADSGLVPLAVGNSHLWPLGIWEQHISLSLTGDAVYRSPQPAQPGSAPPPGWDLLRKWSRSGYFLRESWSQGWAQGIQAAAAGNAAMVLISGRMITSIPVTELENFIFRPFPRGAAARRWAVGSGILIYRNLESQHPDEVQKLFDYLTSEAVTAALTAETRQLFFSSAQSSAGIFIPSWEKLANEPSMRSYARELNDFVRLPAE